MRHLHPILSFISHHRYWIVTIAGILIVGVLDENSFMQRVKYSLQISDLKEQISSYRSQYEKDDAQLKELRRNPYAITRIAREKYFMKADDEDIFVLSDDFIQNNKSNETTE